MRRALTSFGWGLALAALTFGGCDGDDDKSGATRPGALPEDDPSALMATPILFGDAIVIGTTDGIASDDEGGLAIATSGPLIEPLVASASLAANRAALFAVVDAGGGQRIEAFDGAGGAAWHLDVGGTLRRPAERGEHLMVVASESDGQWYARWVARADGAVVAEKALGPGPATAPARLRTTDDDWLVGVGARVVALSVRAGPPATIEEVAAVDTEGVLVTSVFTTGSWLWGATGWADGVARDGLGDRLVAAMVGEGSPTGTAIGLIGHPIATPGEIEAPPILGRAVPVCDALGGCTRKLEGVIASGGSHWLGVWRADTGEAIGVESGLPERVTGLAIAGNGEIMSGGSHWHPGAPAQGMIVRGRALRDGAALSVVETFTSELAEDAWVIGVPSPIVRVGEVVVAALTTDGPRLVTIARAGVGPAVCGWARAFGDARNSGSHVMDALDPCAATP